MGSGSRMRNLRAGRVVGILLSIGASGRKEIKMTKEERENKIVEDFRRSGHSEDTFTAFMDGWLCGERANKKDFIKYRGKSEKEKSGS